jgi:hypothetical protein
MATLTNDQAYELDRMNSTAYKHGLGTSLKAITPAKVLVYAAQVTTAGGAVLEAVSVTGVLATDLVLVNIKAKGATPRTIVQAAGATNLVNVTFSGDPSTDHVIQYFVFR